MTEEAQLPETSGIDPFLEAYLDPFRAWLEQPDVTELLVNRPGEVWIEQAGRMTHRTARGTIEKHGLSPGCGCGEFTVHEVRTGQRFQRLQENVESGRRARTAPAALEQTPLKRFTARLKSRRERLGSG